MPVVPITSGQSQSQGVAAPAQPPLPSPTFLLMAAAQMHSEGRLVAAPSQSSPSPQAPTS